MKAITPCDAALFPSLDSLNVIVCAVQKINMPTHEVRKSFLRPTRSTRNEALNATARFQICKIPLIRSCVVERRYLRAVSFRIDLPLVQAPIDQ